MAAYVMVLFPQRNEKRTRIPQSNATKLAIEKHLKQPDNNRGENTQQILASIFAENTQQIH
jgi:hypothetical protein